MLNFFLFLRSLYYKFMILLTDIVPSKKIDRRMGSALRYFRLEHMIGIREFAKLMDILPSGLCEIEQGKHMDRKTQLKFFHAYMAVITKECGIEVKGD